MMWLESGRIPMPWHRTLIAYASRQTPKSGAFQSACAELSEAGMISYRDRGLVLEQPGRERFAYPLEPSFTIGEYWTRMEPRLGPIESRICFWFLGNALASPIFRPDLARAIEQDVDAPDFQQAIASLRDVGLIELDGDHVQHTQQLRPRSIFEIRAQQDGKT